MMTQYNMLTIGEYQPLAGLGLNTIRRSSFKYTNLKPGDEVRMIYATELDDNDEPVEVLATEILTVTAVVIASYETIMQHHARTNHGGTSPQALREHFEKCYPDFKDDDEFMAIYFS